MSTFSWVWLAVELLLLAFHFSVLVCIIRQINEKNNKFTTAFYKLYVLRSLADYGAYASVCSLSTVEMHTDTTF